MKITLFSLMQGIFTPSVSSLIDRCNELLGFINSQLTHLSHTYNEFYRQLDAFPFPVEEDDTDYIKYIRDGEIKKKINKNRGAK
jgi:hypothetical protein